jgi:hypothetical protein
MQFYAWRSCSVSNLNYTVSLPSNLWGRSGSLRCLPGRALPGKPAAPTIQGQEPGGQDCGMCLERSEPDSEYPAPYLSQFDRVHDHHGTRQSAAMAVRTFGLGHKLLSRAQNALNGLVSAGLRGIIPRNWEKCTPQFDQFSRLTVSVSGPQFGSKPPPSGAFLSGKL